MSEIKLELFWCMRESLYSIFTRNVCISLVSLSSGEKKRREYKETALSLTLWVAIS